MAEAQATETVEREFDRHSYENPIGSLKTVPLTGDKALKANPHRPEEVFKFMEDKVEGLLESYISTSFQSTFEVTEDKWGQFYIAGGGHHRWKALLTAIERGLADRIKGLFKKDGEWCIKVVGKKYSKEEMLKAFMLENADAWGKDDQQNQAMMAIQVKSYLDGMIKKSKDLADFIGAVNSPYPLKMNAQAYGRAKKQGCGASLMVQYLGTNTWSRPAVEMLLKVLYDDGKTSKQYQKLAEALPNVTMAYRVKQLMTEVDEDGDKVKASQDDQDKAIKLIEKHDLTRADIEAADKIKAEQGLSPLEALDTRIQEKVTEKAEGKKPASKSTEPQKVKAKPAEEALKSITSAKNFIKLMLSENDSWSASQLKMAKNLLNEIFEDVNAMK